MQPDICLAVVCILMNTFVDVEKEQNTIHYKQKVQNYM
jgi:hypothetical protein